MKTAALFPQISQQVDSFLKENHIAKKRTWISTLNGIFVCSAAAATYGAYLYWGSTSVGLAILLTCAWAFFTMVVQFSVMHDGSHGAPSNSWWLNTAFTFPIQFIGASAILWKGQHCKAHHGFTNIHKLDHDVDTGGVLRLHTSQPLRPHHRNQHLFAWVLYGLFVHAWVWWGDVRDILRNTYNLPKKELRNAAIETVLVKIWHIAFFIVLPTIALDSFALAFGYYFLSFSLLGFAMAVVFQLAHISNVQTLPNDRHEARSDWALRQLETTANFATKNRFLTWATGALNFQIEHHIFPAMSHFNYPTIAPVVERVARERGAPYFNFPTLWSALVAHQTHLKRLGRTEETVSAATPPSNAVSSGQA